MPMLRSGYCMQPLGAGVPIGCIFQAMLVIKMNETHTLARWATDSVRFACHTLVRLRSTSTAKPNVVFLPRPDIGTASHEASRQPFRIDLR